jgi:quinolinate synthase
VVKALSNICCTSANAVKVAKSLQENEILMVPDRNLARYTASQTDKKIHLWDGYCPYHDLLRANDVKQAKQAHPDAVFMAHPECRIEVLKLADIVTSTSGMLTYATRSDQKSFIVGTEVGLLYPLKKANPEKDFYPASLAMECKDMKKITMEDIKKSLRNLEGQVKVPEDIRKPALKAVSRMVEL